MELEILQNWGLLGLFVGCFLAATVIPFSAEILVVGALVAGCNPLATFLVATTGNSMGSLTSYYIGYLGKWEWIERWFHVTREKLERQKAKIDKFGPLLAFLCWLPFIGDVFAIGLGFYKLNFVKCLIFIILGKATRFGVCTILFLIYGERILEYFS
ncbi:MAG: DedA family protein [Bacteroidales bacterium]|nr:DedA family protein [Bacteroidales bacterium]